MSEARAYLAGNGTYNIKYNGALIQGCTITGELVSFTPESIKYDDILPSVGETLTSNRLREVATAMPIGTVVKWKTSVMVLSRHHSDNTTSWFASGMSGSINIDDIQGAEYTVIHIPGPEGE